MARSDEEGKFIHDGLFRYAAARATVLSFEDAVKDRVAEIVADSASPLTQADRRPKVEDFGLSKGDDGGRVAYAQFRGRLGSEAVTWEFGIWWEDPADGEKVEVYGECVAGPRHLTQKEWAEVPKGAEREWSAYRGSMHLVVRPGDDLKASFRRLISEVAKQAKRAGR